MVLFNPDGDEATRTAALCRLTLICTENDSHPSRAGHHALALMEQTPALVEYAERMWFRHEDALIAAITDEFGLPEPSDEIRFYVRFALQIQLSATRDINPESTIDAGFRLLDEGWLRHQRRFHSGSCGPLST